MVGAYQAFHERSIRDPDGFWGEQAGLIDWNKPYNSGFYGARATAIEQIRAALAAVNSTAGSTM